MGFVDRFQAPESVDIWIMLHSFLRINLRTLRPQKQENSSYEQLSHQGNKLIVRRNLGKHAGLAALFSWAVENVWKVGLPKHYKATDEENHQLIAWERPGECAVSKE